MLSFADHLYIELSAVTLENWSKIYEENKRNCPKTHIWLFYLRIIIRFVSTLCFPCLRFYYCKVNSFNLSTRCSSVVVFERSFLGKLLLKVNVLNFSRCIFKFKSNFNANKHVIKLLPFHFWPWTLRRWHKMYAWKFKKSGDCILFWAPPICINNKYHNNGVPSKITRTKTYEKQSFELFYIQTRELDLVWTRIQKHHQFNVREIFMHFLFFVE